MSVNIKTKKSVSKYTRISLKTKLLEAISEVQGKFPLYDVNDVIYFLINRGYNDWQATEKTILKGNPQKIVKLAKQIDFNSKNIKFKKFTSNKDIYKEVYDEKYGQ